MKTTNLIRKAAGPSVIAAILALVLFSNWMAPAESYAKQKPVILTGGYLTFSELNSYRNSKLFFQDLFATYIYNNNLLITDSRTGELQRILTLENDTNDIRHKFCGMIYGLNFKISEDKSRILSSDFQEFDFNTGKRINDISCSEKQNLTYNHFILSPDSKNGIFTERPIQFGTVFVYDLTSGDTLKKFSKIDSVSEYWYRNNSELLTFSKTGKLKLWDASNWTMTKEMQIPGYTGLVQYSTYSKTNNPEIVFVQRDSAILSYNIKEEKVLASFILKFKGGYWSENVHVSTDTDEFCYLEKDSSIVIADFNTGNIIKKIKPAIPFGISQIVSYLSDGKNLLLKNYLDMCFRYNIESGKMFLFNTFQPTNYSCLELENGNYAFSNNSSYIIVTNRNWELLFFKLTSSTSFRGEEIKLIKDKNGMLFTSFNVLYQYDTEKNTCKELYSVGTKDKLYRLGTFEIDPEKKLVYVWNSFKHLDYDKEDGTIDIINYDGENVQEPVYFPTTPFKMSIRHGNKMNTISVAYGIDMKNNKREYVFSTYDIATKEMFQYNTYKQMDLVCTFLKKQPLLVLFDSTSLNFYDLTTDIPVKNLLYSIDLKTKDIFSMTVTDDERYLVCGGNARNYIIDLKNRTFQVLDIDPIAAQISGYEIRCARLSNDRSRIYYTDLISNFVIEDISGVLAVDDNPVTDTPSLMVFPNPSFEGKFTVKFAGTSDSPTTIRVLNALGETVYERSELLPVSMVSEIKVDLGGLSSGAYRLMIENGGKLSSAMLGVVK